jgi:CheY-like chemotaxis protein
MLLAANGYRVLTAANGKEALQAFVAHSVDLVLLDYHMPEMNGSTVAARMKDFKPEVPVALLSGDEHLPPSELDAVDCFMPKSEPISSFLEKVDYLLSMRFLFRPFGGLKAEHAEDRIDGYETGPNLHRVERHLCNK